MDRHLTPGYVFLSCRLTDYRMNSNARLRPDYDDCLAARRTTPHREQRESCQSLTHKPLTLIPHLSRISPRSSACSSIDESRSMNVDLMSWPVTCNAMSSVCQNRQCCSHRKRHKYETARTRTLCGALSCFWRPST